MLAPLHPPPLLLYTLGKYYIHSMVTSLLYKIFLVRGYIHENSFLMSRLMTFSKIQPKNRFQIICYTEVGTERMCSCLVTMSAGRLS